MTLYWTTVRLMKRKGTAVSREMLHTRASALRVNRFRNFDSSEPQTVPRIPAATVTPPNAIEALQAIISYSACQWVIFLYPAVPILVQGQHIWNQKLLKATNPLQKQLSN